MSGARQPSAAVPGAHRAFIARAVERLAGNPRLVGVAAAGSFADDMMDEFSDVDLVIAVEPPSHAAVLDDRRRIAEGLGPLLGAFTGEHVGDPRLLICLYGPPPLHADLKFVGLGDAARRGHDPVVLWERDGRLSDVLSFLRARVLGPLAMDRAGFRPAGVRRLEQRAPVFAEELRTTVAVHDARACLAAVRACVEVYRRLREPDRAGAVQYRSAAEVAAMDYLAALEGRP